MLFSGEQQQPLAPRDPSIEQLLERLEGEVAKQGVALAQAREELGRIRKHATSQQRAKPSEGWCEASMHEAAVFAQELSEEGKLQEWGMHECATLRERVHCLDQQQLRFEAKEQCLGEEIAAEAQSEFHEAQRVRLDTTAEELAQGQKAWLERARKLRGFVVDGQRGQEKLRAQIRATEEEEQSLEVAAFAAASEKWPGASDVENRLVLWSRHVEEQRAQIRMETVAVEHVEELLEQRSAAEMEGTNEIVGSQPVATGTSIAQTALWDEGSAGPPDVSLQPSIFTIRGRTTASDGSSPHSA
mmetsp:Transcript_112810/g.224411  ORF Transcript_112810/g.224411 Transcript_112810/m.224411 type:complete len:301 (+) Transcript_112810:50-952(+)